MDHGAKLEALLELAEQLDITVRREPLGGEGGGLCHLRGQRVLFVDIQADLQTRFEKTAAALAGLPEVDQHYLLPELREELDRHR
jgi:hypothetical protein